ncbi:MAG: 16S rRNA (cytosine(1402)-N(4))-methyltransferase RsmH [Alphaproteobacteria bacterium]|nr:16S rRNA (cytosine(1402)-N(4))-methyltransferase RsmH [Alphaproteobacteria bacterium]
MSDAQHVPVMLAEVLEALAPRTGGLYVDGTFGAGGYSRAILDAAPCRVIGLDRDPEAIARGGELVESVSGRLDLIEGRFGAMAKLLGGRGVDAVDGIAFDLGVSSPQIDTPERGFSFRQDGPLDMRMGRSGRSAADLVNQASEAELARIFRDLGEERRAHAVARAIVARRATQPISRTIELAGIIRTVVRPDASGIDPATRVFQALRMAVNDELGELEQGLEAAERLLRPEGRLVVVAFHSLEDRCVKQFLRARAKPAPAPSRHLPPLATEAPQPSFRLLHAHAIRPSASECRDNPRARSARLRAAVRTGAPAWSERRAA